MDGKEILGHIASLKDNVRQYLETKISYYGILAFEKAVKLLSMIMANLVTMTFLMIALLFLSGAAALAIGKLLDSYILGLLIIGGLYLLLSLIFITFRKSIFGRMAIKIVLKIFTDEDADSK
jgi:hypothetical protein